MVASGLTGNPASVRDGPHRRIGLTGRPIGGFIGAAGHARAEFPIPSRQRSVCHGRTPSAVAGFVRRGGGLVGGLRETGANGPRRRTVGIAGAGKDHLALLNQIAQVFIKPDEVAKLRAARTPDEVKEILVVADK